MDSAIFTKLGILSKIWQAIRGTSKVEKIGNNLLSNNDVRKSFLKENKNATIINVAGNLYIGDFSKMPEDKKQYIKEAYDGNKNKAKIDVMNSDFYCRVEKFKTSKGDIKPISKCFNFLDSQVKNILELSAYAEDLFNQNDSAEAQRVRSDIGDQYGKWGRKLSNLYLSGYINGMIEFLKDRGDELKDTLNEEIRNFVNSSDPIYFIHEDMSENVVGSIISKIKSGIGYIAVHSAGRNLEYAREIKSEIETIAEEEGYDIKEDVSRSPSNIPLSFIRIIPKKTNEETCSDELREE